MAIKISKTKERLYILDFPQVRPVLDYLNFVGSHKQSFQSENVAQILHPILVEFTFFRFRIEAILLKALEDFFNLSAVSSCIGRVNKNIIKIDDHADIQHI